MTVVIKEIDTENGLIILMDGRIWPITNTWGPSGYDGDIDEADGFVAGQGSEWITERFSTHADRIK